MKFFILENDGMSLKPFYLFEIEAENKEEAYNQADEQSVSNFCSCWVLTEEELNGLGEILK